MAVMAVWFSCAKKTGKDHRISREPVRPETDPFDEKSNPPAMLNIINLRLDITHLYYPAKNSFQKSRLKRREIFTELLLYTLTT